MLNSGMTLQDLEWQGLLKLPELKHWVSHDTDIAPTKEADLTLERVQMWGYEEDNDEGVRLFCIDTSGNQYEAEISHVSECLNRAFINNLLVESYGQNVNDLFCKKLEIERITTPLFATTFIYPGLADMRLRTLGGKKI